MIPNHNGTGLNDNNGKGSDKMQFYSSVHRAPVGGRFGGRGRLLAAGSLLAALAGPSIALADGAASNSVTPGQLQVPPNAPAFLPAMWSAALSAPLPNPVGAVRPPTLVPQNENDPNSQGVLGTYQPNGPTTTATNAFFQSLGTNGRSCFSCHRPVDGMGISTLDLQVIYSNNPNDPVFAPIDGANCPNRVPASSTSGSLIGGLVGGTAGAVGNTTARSLLLSRGLFRIFLPVPDNAEFSISLQSDPNGCNTDPAYNSSVDPQGNKHSIVSMYRRPRISSNLPFVANADPSKANSNLICFGPTGPAACPPSVSAVMWDGREPSLQSQAIDATLGHAQATSRPTDDQVNQIVAFETHIFSAQSFDKNAGSLTALGATGGPQAIAATTPGQIGLFSGVESLGEYAAWKNVSGTAKPASAQASIFRGQEIFHTRGFTVSNVAGFNDLVGNPAPNTTCSTCHNEIASGEDLIAPPQRGIGIGGDSANFSGPKPDSLLPIFALTCPAGKVPFVGSTTGNVTTVTTNDPGLAMITGKCADIGRFTAPPLRALAVRAPYFHDGSANTLMDVVNFYNTRFGIGLSATDKQDLVNFLAAL